MHFSSSIGFDFMTPSFSAFTHAHNESGYAVETRQVRCLWKPTSILRSFCFWHTIRLKKIKRLWDRHCHVLMLLSAIDWYIWLVHFRLAIVHLAQKWKCKYCLWEYKFWRHGSEIQICIVLRPSLSYQFHSECLSHHELKLSLWVEVE